MSKKKILVVDDETQLCDLVKMRLEANHYDVITANNGLGGLEKAKKESPDLILLDILMPSMDGYQTLQRLKEDVQTKSIPVIMLTAKSQVEDVTKAVDLGALDYIVKPFSPMTFLDKVRKAVG